MAFAFALIAFIIIIVVLIGRETPQAPSSAEPGERRAGKLGEKKAAAVIKSAMQSDDLLFTNVYVEHDGKRAELDNVIVNKYGVFIIEVKNYRGWLVGGEDDHEWKKYKITGAENVYEKNVRNPIKQVKRQIYVLSRFLEANGAGVWIRGYAMLLEGNSPVVSEYILNDRADVERVIHTEDRKMLDEDTVKLIAALLA